MQGVDNRQDGHTIQGTQHKHNKHRDGCSGRDHKQPFRKDRDAGWCHMQGDILKALIDKLEREGTLSRDEFLVVYEGRNEIDRQWLSRKAFALRCSAYGNDVYLRALIECSSYCRSGCFYCGINRTNCHAERYRLSPDEVIEAAKLANAHSFIKRLPNGYDTMLTSDGANLSQGQRQLLAIARAAIANLPVLILDEATSSIDTRTEKLIEKGMDRLMENRTVFVIAHRLSTVRNSDAIMVLDHGEIIERGNHDELIQQKGRYYQLYTGQFELD